MGDRWQEYEVIHPGVKKWMDVTGETDISKCPYANYTSANIDWIGSVDMQAAAQRWIEHSLSKTVNLPSDVTKELVSQVYMRGWKSGCKGLTIYRDGSRSGVLIDKKDDDDRSFQFEQHSAPKRPDKLPCEIHHANIKGESWTIIVGLLNGKPYEVFGGLSKYVVIPKKHNAGYIIKNLRKTTQSSYDLHIDGADIVIKNIVEQFDNPNYSDLTRMISLTLRHGADCKYVVEQLQKGERESDMFSFGRSLARVLKSYIVDGEKSNSVKKCPECGSDKMRYQDGCPLCLDCGYTRC
jgi:ribonucleoside-diphosphate reductase alpha chain